MNEAIALLALGRMDEALAGFDAALAREPGHVHALFNRGLARKRAGLPGAEEDFARVHEIDPEDPDALYQLATARMDRRDHAGAREAFERLLKSDPAYLSAYFALGRVLLLLGEREKAQVYLERFQELKATSPMAETVGPAYGEQGVYSLAEDVPSPPADAAPAIPRRRSGAASWGLPAERRGRDRRGWRSWTSTRDGRHDLGVATAAGLRLFRNAGARFVEVARPLAGARQPGSPRATSTTTATSTCWWAPTRGAALLLNQGGAALRARAGGGAARGRQARPRRGHGGRRPRRRPRPAGRARGRRAARALGRQRSRSPTSRRRRGWRTAARRSA